MWVLQIPLDKNYHLSAMEHPVTISALSNIDPSLVAECFGGHVKTTERRVMVTQELERLVTLFAVCLCTSVMGPSSGVLADVCQQYVRMFPPDINFDGLLFHYTFSLIHSTSYQVQDSTQIRTLASPMERLQAIQL